MKVVQVEYYVKAVTNMEKWKVAADKGMQFLISAEIKEKEVRKRGRRR